MRIYTCHHCQNNDHTKCEHSHHAPAGHYGGSKCDCPCDGDVNWRDRVDKEWHAEMKRVNALFTKMDKRNLGER